MSIIESKLEALPGEYTVRLRAGGRALEQRLTVKMDPRVKTPMEGLRQQFALSQRLAAALRADSELLEQVRKLRKERPEDEGLAALEGTAEEPRPWAKQHPPALVPWNARILAVYQLLQSTDAAPTPQAVRAAETLLKETEDLFARARAALSGPPR